MKKNDKNWVEEMAAEVIKTVAQYAGDNAEFIARSICGEEEVNKRRKHRKKKIDSTNSSSI